MEFPIVSQADDASLPARQRLQRLIESHGIIHADSLDQPLISPNGERRSCMIDLRPVLLSSSGLEAVAELFWDRFEDELPFQIGGVEMAAVPLVAALLMGGARRGYGIEGFVVRKERKRYGRMQDIENDLSILPLLVVDDVFNSGASLDRIRVVLEAAGRTIWRVWTIVNFRSRAGSLWQRRHGLTIESVFDLGDFQLEPAPPLYADPQLQLVPRWHHSCPGANHFFSMSKSAPVCHEGRVYIGSESETMDCLDGATGAVVWTFDVGVQSGKGIGSTACICDDLVVFGARNGHLYALNKDTGHPVWQQLIADSITSSAAWAPELNTVYIGCEYLQADRKGAITAVNARTGEQRWHVTTQAGVAAAPLYSAETASVLCGANDGQLLALDAATGQMRWHYRACGAIKHAPAIDIGRRLAVLGSVDGILHGIDLMSGELRFSVRTGGAVYARPLIEGNDVYCGSTDEHLYVVDIDRQDIRAKIPVRGKILSTVQRIGAWLVFGSTDGCLCALDPVSMQIAGSRRFPEAITTAADYDVVNRSLVAATNGGTVYGIALLPRDNPIDEHQCEPRDRQTVTVVQLARQVVDSFATGAPLPDPKRIDVDIGEVQDPQLSQSTHGGAFVSLRDRTTGKRVGRAGQWAIGPDHRSLAHAIVCAAAKACAPVSAAALANVSTGVAVFGPLTPTALGGLDASRTGIVVRSEDHRHVGGALPNCPEFANEHGQYRHALRNAGLSPIQPHTIYRHSVAKYTESDDWPSFGAPVAFDATAISALLQSVTGRESASHDGWVPTSASLAGIVITPYLSGSASDSVFVRFDDVAQARERIAAAFERLRAAHELDSKRDAAYVISLLFKGKQLDDNHVFDRKSFRIAHDALIRVNAAREHVQIPALSLQSDSTIGDTVSKLRSLAADGPGSATSSESSRPYWEVCPCSSWLIDDDGAQPLAGALTDASGCVDEQPAMEALNAVLDATIRHLPFMTPQRTTYLPVPGRYVGTDDGPEQYVALMVALANACTVLNRTETRLAAQTSITRFLHELENERARWDANRRAILRALLARPHGMRSATHAPLEQWAKESAMSRATNDGLEFAFVLRTAIDGLQGDLRELTTRAKAALQQIHALTVIDVELSFECAVMLIRSGFRELLEPLHAQVRTIISWQHVSTGAFVPAMSELGATALGWRLLHALSLASSVTESNTAIAKEIHRAWRLGARQLLSMRVRPADAFCLHEPQRAVGCVRDAQATVSVSAMSSAAAIAALTHAARSE